LIYDNDDYDDDHHHTGEVKTTSLNCGHQRAYCSSPGNINMENHGGMISTGKTDSSTTALWLSYQKNHLVANQEILAKDKMHLALRSVFVHVAKFR
jgi:hypothetical protein